MIRVLHVIGAMNCGGAETLIMNIYRKIDRTKMQFDFVVHTHKKCFYDDEIEKLGGKIYRVKKFNVANFVSYYQFWEKFYGEHKEYKIIHGHINSSAAIYLFCAKRNNKIAVVHSHNTMNTEKNIRSFAFLLFSYPIRYIADYFFACSTQAGLDRFGKKIVNSSKFCVMKNAIDTQKYLYNESIRRKIRSQMKIEDNVFVIGHVGRFSYQKNHELLIEVFGKIHQKIKAELWLIGDGELKEVIRQKVAEMQLTEDVRFIGVTSHVADYLQAMDAFVFPSRYEGLGIALVEAQISGMPCITSDSIQKEADIGGNLITYMSRNDLPEKWAETILSLKNRKRKKVEQCAKESGYDIECLVPWLQDFYLNLE